MASRQNPKNDNSLRIRNNNNAKLKKGIDSLQELVFHYQVYNYFEVLIQEDRILAMSQIQPLGSMDGRAGHTSALKLEEKLFFLGGGHKILIFHKFHLPKF